MSHKLHQMIIKELKWRKIRGERWFIHGVFVRRENFKIEKNCANFSCTSFNIVILFGAKYFYRERGKRWNHVCYRELLFLCAYISFCQTFLVCTCTMISSNGLSLIDEPHLVAHAFTKYNYEKIITACRILQRWTTCAGFYSLKHNLVKWYKDRNPPSYNIVN